MKYRQDQSIFGAQLVILILSRRKVSLLHSTFKLTVGNSLLFADALHDKNIDKY